MILALMGSLSVLMIGATVFVVLLKRDMSAKRKMQGLSSAAEIDAEARLDYQVSIGHILYYLSIEKCTVTGLFTDLVKIVCVPVHLAWKEKVKRNHEFVLLFKVIFDIIIHIGNQRNSQIM